MRKTHSDETYMGLLQQILTAKSDLQSISESADLCIDMCNNSKKISNIFPLEI